MSRAESSLRITPTASAHVGVEQSRPTFDVLQLRKRVDEIPWFHTMDLGHGIRTNGKYDPSRKLARYGIPEDLSGKSVLDVGAWDGFYSFEAERRGAARVLATDSFVWQGKNWGTKEGFELARSVKDSHVEDKTIDVMDLSPEAVGTFDLVLFLGVLYHVKDPFGAIERVASVCHDHCILETHVDLVHVRRPAIAMYRWLELDKDPTNWFGPNPAAVINMLYAAGFRRVTIQPPSSRLYAVPKYFATRALKRGHRMVFHAFK